MIDALEFLSRPHSHLGLPEAPDLAQKPPVILRRMHRGHLAALFCELGYRRGAEVGVCDGAYSRKLWEHNPEATIYSIDPWQVYDAYPEIQAQEKMEWLYAKARRRLAGTGCVILREFSLDAAQRFEDGALDFVYIDANHEFLHVTQDIAAWSAKVRPGGIVSGHDFARYKRRPICHVKEVISAWTYAHRIKPWFVLRGQGNSSWFWVKR